MYIINNSEIVNIVANDVIRNIHVCKWQTEYIIDRYLKEISTQLKEGNDVKISGLGTFTHKLRKGYIGTDLNTKKTTTIPDRKYIAFKPSKKIK